MPVSPKSAKVTTAKQWKRKKAEELTLPSGNVALVKRPGPEAFLAEGILPDTLMPIIQESIRNGQGLPAEAQKSLLENESDIIALMDTVDKIVAKVVVEPRVVFHRYQSATPSTPLPAGAVVGEVIPEADRDEDSVYTDDVDLEDKMFVFNFAVGGTRDLEKFRAEHAASVGDLLPSEDDARPPVRTRSGATGTARKPAARAAR